MTYNFYEAARHLNSWLDESLVRRQKNQQTEFAIANYARGVISNLLNNKIDKLNLSMINDGLKLTSTVPFAENMFKSRTMGIPYDNCGDVLTYHFPHKFSRNGKTWRSEVVVAANAKEVQDGSSIHYVPYLSITSHPMTPHEKVKGIDWGNPHRDSLTVGWSNPTILDGKLCFSKFILRDTHNEDYWRTGLNRTEFIFAHIRDEDREHAARTFKSYPDGTEFVIRIMKYKKKEVTVDKTVFFDNLGTIIETKIGETGKDKHYGGL